MGLKYYANDKFAIVKLKENELTVLKTIEMIEKHYQLRSIPFDERVDILDKKGPDEKIIAYFAHPKDEKISALYILDKKKAELMINELEKLK